MAVIHKNIVLFVFVVNEYFLDRHNFHFVVFPCTDITSKYSVSLDNKGFEILLTSIRYILYNNSIIIKIYNSQAEKNYLYESLGRMVWLKRIVSFSLNFVKHVFKHIDVRCVGYFVREIIPCLGCSMIYFYLCKQVPWLGRENKSKPWQPRNLQKYKKKTQEYNNK